MATAAVNYTFANDTNADAVQVSANFDALVTFLNASALHADGSVSMSGMLTLTGTTPTLANHATRKGYVDSYFPLTAANLGTDAVTTIKILDASVTPAKLSAAIAVPNQVADTTALAALAGMAEGDTCYVAADNLERYYNGSAWKIRTPQQGSETLTFTASSASAAATVTFPVAYAATPNVIVSVTAITSNTPTTVHITSSSNSQFVAKAFFATGGTFTGTVVMSWIAVEATT